MKPRYLWKVAIKTPRGWVRMQNFQTYANAEYWCCLVYDKMHHAIIIPIHYPTLEA